MNTSKGAFILYIVSALLLLLGFTAFAAPGLFGSIVTIPVLLIITLTEFLLSIPVYIWWYGISFAAIGTVLIVFPWSKVNKQQSRGSRPVLFSSRKAQLRKWIRYAEKSPFYTAETSRTLGNALLYFYRTEGKEYTDLQPMLRNENKYLSKTTRTFLLAGEDLTSSIPNFRKTLSFVIPDIKKITGIQSSITHTKGDEKQ
ncbi:MAG: hypothetical protein ACLFR1_00750 [Spirochaetia bacterium]